MRAVLTLKNIWLSLVGLLASFVMSAAWTDLAAQPAPSTALRLAPEMLQPGNGNDTLRRLLRDGQTHQVVPGADWDRRYPQLPVGGPARDPDCEQAILDFLPWDNGRGAADFLRLYRDDTRYRSTADRLDRHCFQPPTGIHPALSAHVGALVLDGVPFCMAFAVADRRLLTARHCFYRKLNSSRPAEAAGRIADVTFHPLDGALAPRRLARLQSVRQLDDVRTDAIPHTTDMVGVETEAGPAGTPLPRFEPPREGSRVVLHGIFTYGAGASTAIRRSEASTCAIGRVDQSGCIYHGCNTTPGFSGTPLVVLRDGTPTIVGIHVSGATAPGNCVWAARSGGVGNVGARIDGVLAMAGAVQ